MFCAQKKIMESLSEGVPSHSFFLFCGGGGLQPKRRQADEF
jgi:hypothetical protein